MRLSMPRIFTRKLSSPSSSRALWLSSQAPSGTTSWSIRSLHSPWWPSSQCTRRTSASTGIGQRSHKSSCCHLTSAVELLAVYTSSSTILTGKKTSAASSWWWKTQRRNSRKCRTSAMPESCMLLSLAWVVNLNMNVRITRYPLPSLLLNKWKRDSSTLHRLRIWVSC